MSHNPLLTSLRSAVEAAPDDATLRLHLARLLLDTGNLDEAVAQAAAVLRGQPRHVGALALITAATAQRDTMPAQGQPQTQPHFLDAPRGASGQISDQELLRRLDKEFIGVVPPMFVDADQPDDREDFDEEAEHESFDELEAEVPDLTLDDVAGMQEVKDRLHAAVLAPLRNPELARLYGTSLHGGLLLYGPPGCGKTYIARALAGEMGARLLVVSLADVLDMCAGQSERNLRGVFEIARHHAPCVIFLDELDAIGQKRIQVRDNAVRGAVSQLLIEMDGLLSRNDGVFVIGATNHPWDVDVALRRPGRFDRMMLVRPPDSAARETVLRNCLRDRPIAAIDTRALAARTEGYSGADLALLCESAAEQVLLDCVRSGRPRMIEMLDLEQALCDVRPSIGPWLRMAEAVTRDLGTGAGTDSSYDDLLAYLRSGDGLRAGDGA